ncbi:hypothetical protein [Aliarcobacter cryaerophilus]|jgi:hypothetical protein|uniref:hypothetical protein n=1 Tax=Aliarcobacter cryaerophilus TaxID=28198 RepID=UPI0021B3692E|nr:hypothetical protein [Aliarcobacter cryaerophilus]MCT7484718.1 hypothetical protein [Aliarcobacter cryaerophilus]
MPNLKFIKKDIDFLFVLYPNFEHIGLIKQKDLLVFVNISKSQAEKLDLLISDKIENIQLRFKNEDCQRIINIVEKQKLI